MTEATAIQLSGTDRSRVRASREAAGLTQAAAAAIAWPDIKPTSAKSMWARMELNDSYPMRVSNVTRALEVIGLELTGTLRMKAVKA